MNFFIWRALARAAMLVALGLLAACRAGTVGVAPETIGQGSLGPGGAVNAGPITSGGTITFTNMGAPGFWARRFDAQLGSTVCDMESDIVALGSAGGNVLCCRGRHQTSSSAASPFDEQMSFVFRGPLRIKQMVVYQPTQPSDVDAAWGRTSYWTSLRQTSQNLKMTGPAGATAFDGLIGDSCQWYAMQPVPFACGPQSDPFCPGTGPDVNYDGWAGSKLVVFLAAMLAADDASLAGRSCATATPGPNAPWIGFSASELIRDGWGKYFPCHCYDNNNSTVGAGCGEINVFEVVPQSEGVQYGNEQVISTGVRSYQVGSFGGDVCGTAQCPAASLPAGVDLLDACTKAARSYGAVLTAGSANGDCPIWKRPADDRYFYILIDTNSRAIAVGMIHPQKIPVAAAGILPQFPASLDQNTIAGLLAARLPS